MLVLQCQCGKTLTAPEGSHARVGVCPSCGGTLSLPTADPAVIRPPRLLGAMAGHRATIRAASFSSRGELLATVAGPSADDGPSAAGDLPEIRIWDVRKRKLLAGMQGHQDTVLCADFLPSGEWLVTGGADRTLIVWDVSRGMHNVVMGLKEHTLRGHKGRVTSVSINPDGSQMLSADDEGEIRVWDTATWRCEKTIPTRREGVCRLRHSPDGQLLAAAWDSIGPTLVWQIQPWQEYLRLTLRPEEDEGGVYDLAYSPDGAFVAVFSSDLLRIWDLSSCQVAIAIDADGCRSVAFSPDGRMVATAGWELKTRYEILLWDCLTGQCVAQLEGPADGQNCISFSPWGNRLISAGRDLAVHVWEV